MAGGSEWRRALERPSRRAQGKPKPVMLALLIAVILAGVVGLWVLPQAVEYQGYDLGYTVNGTHARVERWRLKLPFGFAAVRQVSTPSGPYDGIRFLRPEQ